MTTAALDVNEPIHALGLDSIMALQVRNRIQSECGLAVSMARLLSDETIAQIARVLVAEAASLGLLHQERSPAQETASGSADGDPLAGRDVSELSDAEVEALLTRFLPGGAR
jgi:aryl carrier-like protein